VGDEVDVRYTGKLVGFDSLGNPIVRSDTGAGSMARTVRSLDWIGIVESPPKARR